MAKQKKTKLRRKRNGRSSTPSHSKRDLVEVQRETLHLLAHQKRLLSAKLQRRAIEKCVIVKGDACKKLPGDGKEVNVDCSSIHTPSVRIVDQDCLDVALEMQEALSDKEATGSEGTLGGVTGKKGYRKVKVAVLVHGSGENPGGGYKRGANGQEEAICRRTNLAACVEAASYPLPEFGCLYVPSLYVIRGGSNQDFKVYSRPRELSAVVAHCYMHMNTTSEGRIEPKYEAKTYAKIVNLLTCLAIHGHTDIVLGAWGCGAYGNPPLEIARLFKKALTSHPRLSKNICFRNIVFAILKNRRAIEDFKNVFGEGLVPANSMKSSSMESQNRIRVSETSSSNGTQSIQQEVGDSKDEVECSKGTILATSKKSVPLEDL